MLRTMRIALLISLMLVVGCPKQEADPKKMQPHKMEIRE